MIDNKINYITTMSLQETRINTIQAQYDKLSEEEQVFSVRD